LNKYIIDDLSKDFNIIYNIDVHWKSSNFLDNLKIFYGDKLQLPKYKAVHCGYGTFKVLIIGDENPEYQYIDTISGGMEWVNNKVFEKKQIYRKLCGGGHRIHCSNSQKETNHDLMILFGQYVDYKLSTINEKMNVGSLIKNTFTDYEEFRKYAYALGDSWDINKEKRILFLRKKSYFLSTIKYQRIDRYRISVLMGEKFEEVYILGIDEGELPIDFFENNKIYGDLIASDIFSYLKFLDTRNNECNESNLKYQSWKYIEHKSDIVQSPKMKLTYYLSLWMISVKMYYSKMKNAKRVENILKSERKE
jgi:hypothetical protein